MSEAQEAPTTPPQAGTFAVLRLLAGERGFEPRLTESESVVLPLDDSPALRYRAFYSTAERKVGGVSPASCSGVGTLIAGMGGGGGRGVTCGA